MAPATARKSWLDKAKGIGIILVVLAHIDPSTNPMCRWLSSFLMPLFFILSGVIVSMRAAYAPAPLQRVLIKKTKQLLYPYLTFSLLAMLYSLLMGNMNAVLSIAKLTVVLEGHSVLWFLPAIWMAECMMLVLLRSKIPNAFGTAVVALGTSAYAALQYYLIGGAVPANVGTRYLILNGLCRAGIGFVFMMAGYWGHRFCCRMQHIPRSRVQLISAAAFVLGFALGWVNRMPDLHYSVQGNPVLYYASALLQSAGVIALCVFMPCSCRILEFFGKNSLIVMATHYTLPVLRPAFWLIRNASTGCRYVDDLLGCAIAMVIEVFIILVIRRCLPFMLSLPENRQK